MHDIAVLSLMVQSPYYGPLVLSRRIGEFVNSFGGVLESLTTDDLTNYKQALLHEYEVPEKTVDDEFGRHRAAIFGSHYDFWRKWKNVAALDGITVKDLVDHWKTHIAEDTTNKKSISISVYAQQHQQRFPQSTTSAEDAIDLGSSGLRHSQGQSKRKELGENPISCNTAHRRREQRRA
eukprot:GHVS01033782.1.p1 GENE.GHVS01033782.1~~GHVS01033782.1.p1  ORF type:complete len:198 (-),score=21.89 GHVS01033782.1:313-849(-)